MPQTKKEITEEYERKLNDWKLEAQRFREKWLKSEERKNIYRGKARAYRFMFKWMLKVNWILWGVSTAVAVVLTISLW